MIDFVHLGHEPKHDARSDYEDEQPDVVVCEKPAEGEHSPEIGDEAGRENHLSHRRVAKSAFDHYGVNHRHRRGGKRNTGDLRLMKLPTENKLREEPDDRERRRK